jgi:hypothetical protein
MTVLIIVMMNAYVIHAVVSAQFAEKKGDSGRVDQVNVRKRYVIIVRAYVSVDVKTVVMAYVLYAARSCVIIARVTVAVYVVIVVREVNIVMGSAKLEWSLL